MDLLRELFRYNSWAALELVNYCRSLPPALLSEIVVGTDRSILHTMTHLIGSEQEYLGSLLGETVGEPVRAGETLSIDAILQRRKALAGQWEHALDRINPSGLPRSAEGTRTETPPDIAILMKLFQHGIDHRTQICTTLTTLGLEPPNIDVWSFWAALHPADSSL